MIGWWRSLNEDEKWHWLLIFSATFMIVWVVGIVLTGVFGDNGDLSDDAALIGVAATLFGLYLSQHRLRVGQQKIYDHVNSVEEHTGLDGDGDPDPNQPKSLGELIRQTRNEMRESFRRNDEVHGVLGERIDQQDKRVEAVHGEVINLGRAFDSQREVNDARALEIKHVFDDHIQSEDQELHEIKEAVQNINQGISEQGETN